MNIVIHGAINSSNFGDVLFAKMFYSACSDLPDSNVDFVQIPRFGVGNFVRKETGYKRVLSKMGYLKADKLVMMSGGYLGLSSTDLYSVVHLYARFIFPARIYQFIKKPVYIIGVSGGPIENKWLRKSVIKLIDHAEKVIVRDEETKDYLIQYGATNDIEVTADTALSIDKKRIPEIDDLALRSFLQSRKTIFLHSEECADLEVAKSIIPSLNLFLSNHPEYGIVFGYDYQIDRSIKKSICWDTISCEAKFAYEYKSVDQMLALLNNIDVIITTKLHVGILGSVFGKSVLAFPEMEEKTKNFYKQIGYSERCIPLSKINEEIVLYQLEKYYDKPIEINDELIKRAQKNLATIRQLER